MVEAWHWSQVKSVSVCRGCEFARAVPGPSLGNMGMEAFQSSPGFQPVFTAHTFPVACSILPSWQFALAHDPRGWPWQVLQSVFGSAQLKGLTASGLAVPSLWQ